MYTSIVGMVSSCMLFRMPSPEKVGNTVPQRATQRVLLPLFPLKTDILQNSIAIPQKIKNGIAI